MKKPSDPAIEDIRRVRHEISREVNHDPEGLVDYYRRIEEQHRDRLISTEQGEQPGSGRSAA